MQFSWLETFLRPFSIMYSMVLVYIMDMVLIESRFSKQVYFGTTALCGILSAIGLIVLYRVGGLEVMQKYSIFVGTLPSCILYYFLSKHRGSRFFLAFCTADMACMAMIMLSLSISMFLGGGLFVILLTRLILITLITFFVVKWVRKPFCRIMNDVKKGWGAAAFVTMLFYLLLYGYFLFPTSIEQRPTYVPVGMLILILLFSCYWFIYKTISWLNEIHLAEKTEQGLRLQLALQKEQYGAIEEKIKVDQMFRHDLRHHAKLLAQMLGEKKIEEALAYTQKIGNYTLDKTRKNYCENVVVNAVLSAQLKTAEMQGIVVTCKAVLPTVVDRDEMELCVVLSNLLENAIEHCQKKGTNASLDISIKKNKEQILIRIRNSFDGKLIQNENGDYLSSKLQGGIGLKSVSAIVAKHHGVINITHTEKTFTVDVAL